MKKITLISILTFFLIAQAAYAEKTLTKESVSKEEPSKVSKGELSKPVATALSTAGDIPDATPGSGITGSIMPFLNESFQTDLATGAGTLTIAITVPPGRKNMQPRLALSYSSNNSNGICGVGWAIPSNFIQRSTKDGVPKYDATDTFIFISSGSNAELVNIGTNEYRAKIESGFMKYIFINSDPNNTSWIVYDKSGTKYLFGQSPASRLENGVSIFGWYLDRVEDVYGNYITYIYEKPQDGNIYLKEIYYTGGTGLEPDKRIVLNYAPRQDKLYSYRSGWQIITSQYLTSIYVYLKEADVWQKVWNYDLAYTQSPDTSRLLLQTVTVYDRTGNPLPPKTFTYQTLD